MELLLRIIQGRDDLQIVEMVTQNTVPNLYGREVRFDVFAKDSQGTAYDFEVQRSDAGAVPLRARYNSSLLDAMEVQKAPIGRIYQKPASYSSQNMMCYKETNQSTTSGVKSRK